MRKNRIMLLIPVLVCLLSGCYLHPVRDLYCLPKRSESHQDLQGVIDQNMADLEYCAPLTGENRQPVQLADLDGDGKEECLLFSKSTGELPLKILIFGLDDGNYVLQQMLEANGTAFDRVEYVSMDTEPGLELVVGCQLNNQLLGTVSVYTFVESELRQQILTPYTEFLTCDLDADGLQELLALRAGEKETDNGIAELFQIRNGAVEKSMEEALSAPAGNLKRIISGKLHGGQPAVFVGSSVEENAIITDIYTLIAGEFTNISLSAEAGTSVQTLRNYYVYAEDIDSDGEVELPDLINMLPLNATQDAGQQHLIRWYAMGSDGTQTNKRYTFHNYEGGWYLELGETWASQITVVQEGNAYGFYLWDDHRTAAEKIFTVYVLSGQDRETQAVENNRFLLHKSGTVVYAARMEVASGALEITQTDLANSFRLIRQAWNTGEM